MANMGRPKTRLWRFLIVALFVIGSTQIVILNYTRTTHESDVVLPWKRYGLKRNMLTSFLAVFEMKGWLNRQVQKGRRDISQQNSQCSLSDYFGVDYVAPGNNSLISEELFKKHNINVTLSDRISLQRPVPFAEELRRCPLYDNTDDMPTTSVIIPFYNEWPSVLLRTVHSVINRTPRRLLKEILLVDDGSTMNSLKAELERYVSNCLPRNLVRIVRVRNRQGLIRARLSGFDAASGETIVFLDSHMEVNVGWLEPLLAEIINNPRTVAMSTLDPIDAKTLTYKHNNIDVRYGFNWGLLFFESKFVPPHNSLPIETAKPGVVMVGSAFAVSKSYFRSVGAYDPDMSGVWGGENIELSWRVSMCGGQLMHVACSRVGHVTRSQPYTFPGGRDNNVLLNYKRAVEVWVDAPFKQFFYEIYDAAKMKALDVGNISRRLELKKSLNCLPFRWYIDHVYPELLIYNRDVIGWGTVQNVEKKMCLDNYNYVLQDTYPLYVEPCHGILNTQGFSLLKSGVLRTTLHCVTLTRSNDHGQSEARPVLTDCFLYPQDIWYHAKRGALQHAASGLCLTMDNNTLSLQTCGRKGYSQKWTFSHYG